MPFALALVTQCKSVTLGGQHDLALVEGLERAPVADRNQRRCRKLLDEETIERGFGSLIERGRRLIEEQILWRVLNRACDPEPLLVA